MADEQHPKITTEQMLSALAQKQELSRVLGDAISRWVNAEFSLFNIFSVTTGLNTKMAAAILKNVRTFRSLLDICDSVVQQRLRGARELVYWNSIVKYARDLSSHRNFMAHHQMISHSSSSSPIDEFRIGPDLKAVLAGDQRHRSLDAQEIAELLEDFQHLVGLLVDFEQSLKQNLTSQKSTSPLSFLVANHKSDVDEHRVTA